MSLADEVIAVLIEKYVLWKSRIAVKSGNVRGRDSVCCLDVAVTVVNTYDYNVIQMFQGNSSKSDKYSVFVITVRYLLTVNPL